MLDELVDLCLEVQAQALLLAGDVFDSFDAAEALREPFRSRVERLAARCRVLFLPGNHDEQRRGSRRLAALDLGPVTLLDRRPFSLVRFPEEGVEVVGVPERPDYDDFRSWGVPDKAAPVRIVLAHGIVPGMAYTGAGGGRRGRRDRCGAARSAPVPGACGRLRPRSATCTAGARRCTTA